MNPNLTASLNAQAQLNAEIQKQQLGSIREKLVQAEPHIAEAMRLMCSLGLSESYSALYSNLADAHTSAVAAINQIDVHPQPDDFPLSEVPPSTPSIGSTELAQR